MLEGEDLHGGQPEGHGAVTVSEKGKKKCVNNFKDIKTEKKDRKKEGGRQERRKEGRKETN